MNRLTQVRQALLARLSTIEQGKGYLTNAGTDVRSGWLNEVIKTSTFGDAGIVVQRRKGLEPMASPDGEVLKTYLGFSVIACVKADLDGYEDALEDLEADLLRCLMGGSVGRLEWAQGIGATGITVGAPEPYPPGDGEPYASVLVPVYIHTLIAS